MRQAGGENHSGRPEETLGFLLLKAVWGLPGGLLKALGIAWVAFWQAPLTYLLVIALGVFAYYLFTSPAAP